MSTKKHHIVTRIKWHKGKVAECALHPLIHTFLGFVQAQDVERKKAEQKLRSGI